MEKHRPHFHYFNTEEEPENPKYDKITIQFAIEYANDAITIKPSEVGKDVYNKLHTEKIFEYLNNIFQN